MKTGTGYSSCEEEIHINAWSTLEGVLCYSGTVVNGSSYENVVGQTAEPIKFIDAMIHLNKDKGLDVKVNHLDKQSEKLSGDGWELYNLHQELGFH